MANDAASGKGLRIAHGVWAAISVSTCLLLIFGGGGHPPPVVFLPLVIAVWAVGHVAVWSVGWLAAKGRRLANAGEAQGDSWPIGLTLALIGTGAAAALGLVQIVVTGMQGEAYPFRDATLWATTMIAWRHANGRQAADRHADSRQVAADAAT